MDLMALENSKSTHVIVRPSHVEAIQHEISKSCLFHAFSPRSRCPSHLPWRTTTTKRFPYGLGKNTPIYEYQDAPHYSAAIIHEVNLLETHRDRSQYVIFTNVDQEQFSRGFKGNTDTIPFGSYYPRLQILLTKIETKTHANASRDFEAALIKKLAAMKDLDKQLVKVGGAHIETVDRTKRADNAYQPQRLPKYRDQLWPTVVVEVGYSESLRKLANDARWWLTASNGDVKTAITISINQKYREITFEKWGLNTEEEPVVLYRVQMQQDAVCQHVKVSNKSPLVIGFEELFLRPSQEACEGDIVFSQDELKKLASMTWDVHFKANDQ
ncbi:conserved hypothetical protein [Talaromyces marneffei ATCC 18224]|uniref:Uncharacterized protein n=1 Tax=Talaromyces marneffei (strain ATCC 18224 / CBS 334.59 / QM 7333) TaxID=441960 RepID=B6QL32_TALMQ|nr:conserved hypothetical protein [Talaromyces marneffei ATCC 18224]